MKIGLISFKVKSGLNVICTDYNISILCDALA